MRRPRRARAMPVPNVAVGSVMQSWFVLVTPLSAACKCGARTRAGTLGAFEAAEIALRLLHALVARQAATDAGGRPLLPLPRVRRELASPACLPHLAQA